MAMLPVKCAQCGASIEVDDTKETGKCPYCGTTYVTQRVVNNYNTFVYEKETVLWAGETGKVGCIVYAAKFLLILVALFEIIFALIAVFFDIGLHDKWKTFGVLQACLLILAVIFPVMCFQMMGVRYSLTNERVFFYFGMGDANHFLYTEIVDIKLKYAFFERDKKRGTIWIKLRDKRPRPFRNHLRSVAEPEKVYALIKSLMGEQICKESQK